jgi:hypothetical protein
MLARFKPAIPRHYLLAMAGTLWIFAGLLLCVRALLWLEEFHIAVVIVIEGVALAIAAALYRTGFSKLVQRNIERIRSLPERPCLFAFTAWKGYAMIAIMMGAGIALRNVPFPRYFLSGPYTAMGGMLLTGSFGFYQAFFHGLRTEKR